MGSTAPVFDNELASSNLPPVSLPAHFSNPPAPLMPSEHLELDSCESVVTLTSPAPTKEDVLRRMRKYTVTLSVLILLASLPGCYIAAYIIKGLGIAAFVLAPGFTLITPAILIIDIAQIAYAAKAPASLLNFTPRCAVFLFALTLPGIVATLAIMFTLPFFWQLLLLPIPQIIVSALQFGYTKVAQQQAALLLLVERSQPLHLSYNVAPVYLEDNNSVQLQDWTTAPRSGI